MSTSKSLSATQSKYTSLITVQTISALAAQLRFSDQEKFTGQLNLRLPEPQTESWNLYFENGVLVWGDGGVHSVRRLYRCLSHHCPTLTVTSTTQNEFIQQWNHESLTALLMQGKLQEKQLEAVAEDLILEILFDLCQQWLASYIPSRIYMTFSYAEPAPVRSGAAGVPPGQVLSRVTQNWQMWQQAGLKNYSPNQVPWINDHKGLRQKILPSTYQTLSILIDGRRTLRDLALEANKDLLIFTQALMPHVQQGLIKLLEVEDYKAFAPPQELSLPQSASALLSSPSTHSQSIEPLVIYIDDHKEDGSKMSNILEQLGCRCLYVEDPMQMLPILLAHQPKLIFLDLVMPIINGYEACAQIRRISRFKDTPIIILTSADGIVDRIRAKLVGSTDFLAKPIKPEKVQGVLRKYLNQAR